MAAITVLKQPAGVQMARSPIIYMIQDNTAELNNYPYNLDLVIWRGDLTTPPATKKEYRLRAYPDSNGYGVFDISILVQGFFNDVDYAQPGETTDAMTVAVRATGSYTNTDTGTDGNITLIGDIMCQWGYNKYTDDLNYVIDQEDDGFLTDIVDVTQNNPGYFTVFIRHTASSLTENIVILNQEAPLVGWELPVTTGIPSDTDETLLAFPVGKQDLLDDGFASCADKYTVHCGDGTPANSVVPGTTIMNFDTEDNCRYDVIKIDFINRYGTWDRIFCRGNNMENLKTTSASAMRYVDIEPTGDKWKTSPGQYVKFNKQGRYETTVNTGWVSEDYNEVFEQMFLSERVVLGGQSVILTNKSFKIKTHNTEKLINYEFTFESAFDAINSVY